MENTGLRIFDTHAHYDESAFDNDRHAVLAGLAAAGVVGVVNPGCSVASTEAAKRLSEKYPFVFFAAAVHPEELDSAGAGDMDKIAALARQGAVAVGETGLDYHYLKDREDREAARQMQKDWFARHLELANSLDLPVIIHDRDAHADSMELIRKYRPRGVMHCFSGSAEMAEELVKLGFYLGFTGVVTFKNAKKTARAVEAIPLERILIETDSPYMAPEPFRGRRCDSSMIQKTFIRIAEIKRIEPEKAAGILLKNTVEAFPGVKIPE